MNCQFDEDDQDVKNGIMALTMLFANYVVLNAPVQTEELQRLCSLIGSLQENQCFESEQEMAEQLPGLIWTTREGEEENEIYDWETLEEKLRTELSESGVEALDALGYIQDKYFTRLPDFSSSTPFCEGVQDIRRRL